MPAPAIVVSETQSQHPNPKLIPVAVKILETESEATAVLLESMRLVGIVIPAGFEGDEIELQASPFTQKTEFESQAVEPGTFFPVWVKETQARYAVAASTYVDLSNENLTSLVWLKVIARTSGVDVQVQAADRTIVLMIRRP